MEYLTITPLEQDSLPIYQKPYYLINELFLTFLKIKEKIDNKKYIKQEINFYRTLSKKNSSYTIEPKRYKSYKIKDPPPWFG